MKLFFRTWIIILAFSLSSLISAPAYAIDIYSEIYSGRLSTAVELQSHKNLAKLSAENTTALRSSYLKSHLGFPAPKLSGYVKPSQKSAMIRWQRAIAVNPNDAISWNNLGQVLYASEQYSGALMAYDHALLLSPSYSLALANRCGVLHQLEDYLQALNACDLALDGDAHWGPLGSALAWYNRALVIAQLNHDQVP
ncbi:MAG: tetratricopeptide repeat protein [Cyanobacteria bacterium J06621_11]